MTRLPRSLAAAAVLTATLAALIGLTAPTRAARLVVVDVVDFVYQPGTITIQVGDTIQWNNADSVDHTATSVEGTPAAFDVYLAAGAWGSHTFDQAGTYDYFCIPHPTMKGRVVVEPASGHTGVPDVAMPVPGEGRHLAAAGLLAASGLLLAAAAWLRRRRRWVTP